MPAKPAISQPLGKHKKGIHESGGRVIEMKRVDHLVSGADGHVLATISVGGMARTGDWNNDGRILMVMRTQLGAVFQPRSADGGETWSKPQTTGLKQPETCPELIRLSTDDLMIVWCNADYDPAFGSHFGKRSPLAVAVSRDEGATWSAPRSLADAPRTGYYNPVAFCMPAGRVVVSYSETPYGRSWHMTHDDNNLSAAVFDVDWLYA